MTGSTNSLRIECLGANKSNTSQHRNTGLHDSRSKKDQHSDAMSSIRCGECPSMNTRVRRGRAAPPMRIMTSGLPNHTFPNRNPAILNKSHSKISRTFPEICCPYAWLKKKGPLLNEQKWRGLQQSERSGYRPKNIFRYRMCRQHLL